MPETTQVAPTLAWIGEVDGRLRIIDQTLLPGELREIDLVDAGAGVGGDPLRCGSAEHRPSAWRRRMGS